MIYFLAGSEFTCSIILILILAGMLFSNNRTNSKTKYYILCMVLLLFSCTADGISYILDIYAKYSSILMVLNVISFIGVDLIGPAFIYYVWLLIDDKQKISKICICAAMFLNFTDAVFVLIGSCNGKLFYLEDGKTVFGPWYDYCSISFILATSLFLFLVIRRRKVLGLKRSLSIGSYFVFPILTTMLEFINPEYAFVYVALTVVMVIMYISFVSEEIQESAIGEKILLSMSYTDSLTGLLNRRSYEDNIREWGGNGLEDNFVYISVDVNELKMVNDTLGHDAGDELIVGATACMKQCFGPYGRIFRIGGDEFAAIIFASEEQLEMIKTDFENVCTSWSGKLVKKLSVSSGYVPKRDTDVNTVPEIAKLADEKMYEAKAYYYSQKGVDRRGRKEAHTALCELYTKILKINITDDTYQIVNMDEGEQTQEKGFSDSISGWLSGFGKTGQVHQDDLENYLSKTNLAYMRDYFQRDKTSLQIFYRRKYGDVYKQVMMEIIPASDYSNENQNLFLYVKSIDK